MQLILRFLRNSSSSVMPPYFFLPPVHCSTNSLKYCSWWFVADGYIDLALSQDEVSNLVVSAS